MMRTPGMRLAHTGPPPDPGRLYFGCARWRCDWVNPDYLAFSTRRHNYCLSHIPWYVRLSMRLRGES
jgi:hypothetical protein